MNRTHLVFAIAVLCALLGAAGACSHWSSSPETSLRDLGRAFAEHDRLAVEAYIDAGAVASSVVDDMIAGIKDPEGSTGLGYVMAQRLAEGMRPTLEARIRESLVKAVDNPGQSPAGVALMRVTADDLTVTSRRDTVALVRVLVPREDSTGADSLTLRMVQRDRDWVVVGVEGARRWLEGVPDNSRSSAVRSALKSDLRNLASVQESFYADNTRYARSISELTRSPYNWRSTREASMEVEGGETTWQARAKWSNGTTECHMSGGIPGRDDDGVPVCD